MDSNLSWVIHGQGESIAFSARESGVSGHDVFAGNLRGINPIKFNEKMMDESSYWNSSIDDFVLQDIPAFINKIIEVKTRELYSFHKEKNPHFGNDEKAIKEDILKNLKIKYVGHSMGAMLIPMYIILMKLQGKKHHLSSCVSLAGCGLNANVNGVIWAYGCILTNLVCRFTEKI